MMENLLDKSGSTEDFRHLLSFVKKTVIIEDEINVIRTRLSNVGFGYNLVPCFQLVNMSTAELELHSGVLQIKWSDSTNAVFFSAAYRGPDSKFAVGPTPAGCWRVRLALQQDPRVVEG